MQHLDFSPLFRSTIGFDRMTDLLDSTLRGNDPAPAYPPYNIERTGEENYRITMAVAGFKEEDLNIVAQENTLIVSGKVTHTEESRDFLYRGIAGRAFERRFRLADYIRVKDAELENGLLHIDLVREVPETMKPRQVKIGASKPKNMQAINDAA